TRTYSPGASQMGARAPSPECRAGTFFNDWRVTHLSQSGHQLPLYSVAAAHQPSNSPSGAGPAQYWYFGFLTGLMTPAIWPEPARIKRTFLPKSLAPMKTDFAGAM